MAEDVNTSVWRRAGAYAPLLVVALGVGAQALVLLLHARTLWFFGDDWDFLLSRSLTHDTVHSLMLPHNEHWSTLPVIAFRALFRLYGVGSYLPYAALPIGAHVVIVVLGFLILRRAGVRPWPAALATLVVGFLAGGAGAENTLWDFQIGFLGSCAFGMLALWLVQADWRASWGVAIACLVLSLMCSGMGLPMIAWVCLYVLFGKGLRQAAAVGILPLLTYVAWYLAYGRGHAGAPPTVLSVAPEGFMRGIVHVWGHALLFEGAGPVVLAVLVGATLLPRHAEPLFALAASGLMTLIVAYVLFAVTRSGLGAEATKASRYVYFGLVFSLPALACVLQVVRDRMVGRRWAPLVGWVVIASTACALGASGAASFAAQRQSAVVRSEQTLAAAAELLDSGETLLNATPDPIYNPDIRTPHLATGPLHGKLRPVRVSRGSELVARLNLQVSLTPAPIDLPAFSTARWVGFPGIGSARARPLSDCQTRRVAASGSDVELVGSAAGGQVKVAVSGGGIQAALRIDGRDGPFRDLGMSGGEPLYLNSSAPGATLVVHVPSGRITICPAEG